ncbi:GNAT family protein [Heyndrickxia sporothermodurans]|uniref:GNAT family N-acetyltransferase n=1 Tax=Heyndrickxia sporothermodurans TaxID=46224 RepID=UPI002E2075F7
MCAIKLIFPLLILVIKTYLTRLYFQKIILYYHFLTFPNQCQYQSLFYFDRGKGFGYEAMELALDFAFYELNLNRVQLTVFDYNQSAISLYKKLGFQQEGSYREFIHRNGKRHDMLLFGLLKREWESRTEKLE